MNFLVDTHILLWWLSDDHVLSKKGRQLISNPENTLYVSAATGWEISIKKALGKLKTPDDIESVLTANDFELLDINFKHAQLAGALPPHHYDPFDRMLIAQAHIEQLILLTHDKKLKKYETEMILV